MARYAPLALFLALLSLWSSTILSAFASPFLPLPTQFSGRISNRPVFQAGLVKRTDDEPVFPEEPPSCPKCADNYWNINSCAAAAPVLQNFTMIIFNPGAFIDIIKCACVDTFQSTYPQCVDCFIRTDQTRFLDSNSDELPGIVDGMRKICALESTLLGGAQSANGEVTPTSSLPAPTPTSEGAAFALSAPWRTLVLAMLSIVAAALL